MGAETRGYSGTFDGFNTTDVASGVAVGTGSLPTGSLATGSLATGSLAATFEIVSPPIRMACGIENASL